RGPGVFFCSLIATGEWRYDAAAGAADSAALDLISQRSQRSCHAIHLTALDLQFPVADRSARAALRLERRQHLAEVISLVRQTADNRHHLPPLAFFDRQAGGLLLRRRPHLGRRWTTA